LNSRSVSCHPQDSAVPLRVRPEASGGHEVTWSPETGADLKTTTLVYRPSRLGLGPPCHRTPGRVFG
jgi:hypothetical protein